MSDPSFTCTICSKPFSSISNLNHHQKTAKKCLKLQYDIIEYEFVCQYCGYETGNKFNFHQHETRCKEKIQSDTKTEQTATEKLAVAQAMVQYLQKEVKRLQNEAIKPKVINNTMNMVNNINSMNITQANINNQSSNLSRSSKKTYNKFDTKIYEETMIAIDNLNIDRSSLYDGLYRIDIPDNITIKTHNVAELREIIADYGIKVNKAWLKPRLVTIVNEIYNKMKINNRYNDHEIADISADTNVLTDVSMVDDNISCLIPDDILARLNALLPIKEFIRLSGFQIEQIYLDELWDSCSDKNKWIVITTNVMEWLGYDPNQIKEWDCLAGKIKKFRDEIDYRMPKNLSSNLLSDLESCSIIINDICSNKIYVKYEVFKNICLHPNTPNAEDLRRYYTILDKLFFEYLKYRLYHQTKLSEIESRQKDDRIVKLLKSIARYERKHKYHKFNNYNPCYYLFSYGKQCSEGCHTKKLIKGGIAGTKNDDIDSRLAKHRTTFPLFELEFLVFTRHAETVESLIKTRYGEQLNPGSHEVFDSIPLDELKNTIIKCLDLLHPNKDYVIEQTINTYNQDVNTTIKHKD
jgi:hypothetical protein